MAVNLRSGDSGSISDINVTPLVDVMLVLLVIFIVTAPMIVPQSIKIELPKTVALKNQEKIKNSSLVIEPTGRLLYEGSPMGDTDLAAVFKANASNPKYQIQIQADKTVQYGRIAEIMALAQSAGVMKISFVTVPYKGAAR